MNLKYTKEALKKIYNLELKKLGNSADLQEKLTNPHLISIPDNYDKNLKVMIFGQETNDWYGELNAELDVDEFMSKYNEFWIKKKRPNSKKGPLMQTFNTLEESIGKDRVSCLWNNIIKIGKYNKIGTPNKKARDWQKNWRYVIKKEVELLEPDILIFFTGPNYDKYIEEVFGTFTKEVYKNQKTNIPMST